MVCTGQCLWNCLKRLRKPVKPTDCLKFTIELKSTWEGQLLWTFLQHYIYFAADNEICCCVGSWCTLVNWTVVNAVDTCCRLSSDERALVLGAKQLGFVFHTRLPESITITVVSILAGTQHMKKIWTFSLCIFCCCTLCMDQLPTELKRLHSTSFKRHNNGLFHLAATAGLENMWRLFILCCLWLKKVKVPILVIEGRGPELILDSRQSACRWQHA